MMKSITILLVSIALLSVATKAWGHGPCLPDLTNMARVVNLVDPAAVGKAEGIASQFLEPGRQSTSPGQPASLNAAPHSEPRLIAQLAFGYPVNGYSVDGYPPQQGVHLPDSPCQDCSIKQGCCLAWFILTPEIKLVLPEAVHCCAEQYFAYDQVSSLWLPPPIQALV